MPHLQLAAVPHPIGGIDPKLVRAKAETVVDRVLEALTRDPSPPLAASVATVCAVAAPGDLDAFQDFAVAEGWSDGLPVLPPTEERVGRILGRLAGDRTEVIATLVPRQGVATLEAIAVNGAIAARLGINAGANALGQGHRANAVIGRAVRLTLQNVGGARPGREDRATLGHPGKYSYCLAENEAESPWAPLHVERGFPRDASTVTVCGSEGPHNVNDHGSMAAETLMAAIAGTAATTGSNNIYLAGDPLVMLGPEHAQTIASSGWSKAEFKRRFWEAARVPLERFSADNVARFMTIHPERVEGTGPDTLLPFASRPEDVMVIVAGGPGKHSAIVPTFGATRSVTER